MPILGSQSAGTKGEPTTPTIGAATGGNANASVTFTAPSFSKLPITSYTVTSSPGSITGTGASSPVTVSGLTNGTAYTFTVTASTATATSAPSAASNSVIPYVTYSLGDTGPGGGKIFYDAGSVLSWGRYLEGAGQSWSGSFDPAKTWCTTANNNVSYPSTQQTAIGYGASNSATIAAANASSAVAAYACRAYRGGGLSDWFQPSGDELSQLWNGRSYLVGSFVGTGNDASYIGYSSSSEYGPSTTYCYYAILNTRSPFTPGPTLMGYPKNNTHLYVRAIRYV